MVAHHQQHQHAGTADASERRRQHRQPPAEMVRQPRRERQEQQLAGGAAGAEQPMTRPRRLTNQRLATVAPSTVAVRPGGQTEHAAPRSARAPTAPSSASRVRGRRRSPPSAEATTLRIPYRCISAAANGATSPNSSSRSASAPEIWPRSQPNSPFSGSSSTPGMPIAAAVASMVRKVTATTAHP